jgi:hypothetical protein
MWCVPRKMLSGARVWLAIALLLRPNLAHPQTETPIFGTTVVVPSGLQGLIYFIPKGTGRLPGFSTRLVQPDRTSLTPQGLQTRYLAINPLRTIKLPGSLIR